VADNGTNVVFSVLQRTDLEPRRLLMYRYTRIYPLNAQIFTNVIFSSLEVLIRLGSSFMIIEEKALKIVWTERGTSRMRRQKITAARNFSMQRMLLRY